MPDDFGVLVDGVIATVSPEFVAEVTGKAALTGPKRHNRVP
jgi:hypothetical protein